MTIRRRPPTDETWASYESRFPDDKLKVVERLYDELTAYGASVPLPWAPVLRPGGISFQMRRLEQIRPHNVAGIRLFQSKPVEFTVKFAERPPSHRLDGCYPGLRGWWAPKYKQWEWAIPDAGAVPDVGLALDLSTVPEDLLTEPGGFGPPDFKMVSPPDIRRLEKWLRSVVHAQKLPGRGKGSHSRWKLPNGRTVTFATSRRFLLPPEAKQLSRALGLSTHDLFADISEMRAPVVEVSATPPR
jgi:hypothetical protein